MPTVVTDDGVELHCTVCGEDGRPTLVLVHGWSGSSRYFMLNATEVSQKGFRVVSYDQRLHGDSTMCKAVDSTPEEGLTIARLAADLLAALVQFDLQDVTVVGTSMVWSS
jgi:pimeloyl-ACP methyl ester carboxylesterase